jgi:hypothetical protein
MIMRMFNNNNDDDDDDDGDDDATSKVGNDDDEDEEEDEDDVEEEAMFVTDVRGRPAGIVMDDLNWRVEKLRLEEANTKRFLKSGPRFLPYGECCKWVQAWGNRWQNEVEWYVRTYVRV